MEEKRMVLFGPKNGRDLKRQYPELNNVPEFDKLNISELLFVWWFSNPTSPLVTDDNLPEKQRAGFAYEEAFANKNEDVRNEYLSLNFPDRIRLAIDVMRKFNPTVRIRARMIVEKILSKYEKMVDVEMDEFKTIDKDGNEEINWTGRNNYVSSAAKISETLPRLIEQVEQGFGVTESKAGEEGESKAIHRYHSSNKD